jgi:predicted metal-dependent phosphoesterase TrpH
MGKADLHIHTTYSYDGTATVTATLEHVARNTDLDVIAITDHDEIDGALTALELAPHYGVTVISGVEVSTAEGHVLALFVKKNVPRNLSLAETVLCVREQGGLCIAAHPGGRQPWCLKESAIDRALRTVGVADTLVGVETYNASLPDLRLNRLAAAIGRRLGLAPIGNSDAHILWMIGMAATRFPGADAESLRTALRNRSTTLVISARPAHFLVSYLKRQLLRMLGLAQWSPPAPGGPIALRRLAAVNAVGQ